MTLSVVIPVYNEEGNIIPLFERLSAVVSSLEFDSVEFIFVNDGSVDSTLDTIKKLHSSKVSVAYIDLSRNFGHQIAVTAGLDRSVGELIVIIDADL